VTSATKRKVLHNKRLVTCHETTFFDNCYQIGSYSHQERLLTLSRPYSQQPRDFNQETRRARGMKKELETLTSVPFMSYPIMSLLCLSNFLLVFCFALCSMLEHSSSRHFSSIIHSPITTLSISQRNVQKLPVLRRTGLLRADQREPD
jgi:hypothetical protein